jgi:hypothetical protein
MHHQLFVVIAPILCCVLVGYIWAIRDLPYDADFVSRLVMNVGAPCLIVSTLGEVELPQALVGEMVFYSVLGMLAVCLIALAILRLAHLDVRTFFPSLVFPNTGNIGLPLCFFAFGEQGLALALVVFIVISACHFSLGVVIVSGGNFWQQLLRSPVVYAALCSLILVVTQWQLPPWCANTLGLLGDMSIPLMLIALGVSLASLKVQHVKRSILLGAVRILLGLIVALILVSAFDLSGLQRGVLVIEFAMPAAVFNYLLAARYNRGADEVAGLVVASTLLGFISLPLLLLLVL